VPRLIVEGEFAVVELDKAKLIEYMGGEEAVARMDVVERTDAIEHYLEEKFAAEITARRAAEKRYPTVAELAEQVATRPFRRGIGKIFRPALEAIGLDDYQFGKNVHRLPPLSATPTLEEFFELRFKPADHLLQSAGMAKRKGLSEETVLACLLHDLGNYISKTDHGYWGAQMIEPYVSPKVLFAVKYHQVLRFFPDAEVGYDYPKRYYELFGEDYVPPAYMQDEYQFVRNHEWYMEARLVTLNDFYAFDASVDVPFSEFRGIVDRHFRQPEEGLGYDRTPASHMWRTLIYPDNPL
jgi:hypothetical protein